MKYLCFVLLLAVVHENQGKATVYDMQTAEYACYKEMKTKKEDVPDLENFKVETEDTESYRKMFKCMFTKMGILNGQGNIDSQGFDNFVNLVLHEIRADEERKMLVNESLQQCKFIQGENGGEIGLKFKNCLRTAVLNIHRGAKTDRFEPNLTEDINT